MGICSQYAPSMADLTSFPIERSLISAIVRGSALSGNEELIEWALSFYPKSNWKSSYDFDSGYHVVKPSLVELTARGRFTLSSLFPSSPHLPSPPLLLLLFFLLLFISCLSFS